VGAVALGGFHRRSYASVLAVPNHRDDVIAKEAALRISKELRAELRRGCRDSRPRCI